MAELEQAARRGRIRTPRTRYHSQVRQTEPQNPYESYCYSCNVSAPIDARSCVHCGGRLSKQRGVTTPTVPQPFSGASVDENELNTPRRSGPVSPMTAIGVLMFLLYTLFRNCG